MNSILDPCLLQTVRSDTCWWQFCSCHLSSSKYFVSLKILSIPQILPQNILSHSFIRYSKNSPLHQVFTFRLVPAKAKAKVFLVNSPHSCAEGNLDRSSPVSHISGTLFKSSFTKTDALKGRSSFWTAVRGRLELSITRVPWLMDKRCRNWGSSPSHYYRLA